MNSIKNVKIKPILQTLKDSKLSKQNINFHVLTSWHMDHGNTSPVYSLWNIRWYPFHVSICRKLERTTQHLLSKTRNNVVRNWSSICRMDNLTILIVTPYWNRWTWIGGLETHFWINKETSIFKVEIYFQRDRWTSIGGLETHFWISRETFFFEVESHFQREWRKW